MRCEDVRLELSARLDGEIDADTDALLTAHLEGCAECRAHEEGLRKVKRAVALQAAPPVRDVASSVMARISRDVATRRRERRSMLRTAVAAAVVTALVMSGAMLPFRTGSDDVAVASEITRAVQSAATEITSYHATFDITERGWNEDVPERRFAAEIWFESPEHLRMEVHDQTRYPGPGWPTNDATLIAGPDDWWLRETASCPAAALPGCGVPPKPEVRALEHRQPFDGSTVLPTDLILPLETLAESKGLVVSGREIVGGRDAHHVVLQRWQAAPLIDSLQVAGTWHEFSPTARVDLWLDARTWFPLRFTVRGDGGALTVKTTTLQQPQTIPEETFHAPSSGVARDGGFHEGTEPGDALPAYLAGLRHYRSGETRDGQVVDSFVDGMSWLKVVSDRASAPTLATFTSELVRFDDNRFAYYSPSSDALRRTVEILGAERRVRIESNLPRDELLEVARSVPVDGRSFEALRTDDGTITRVDAGEVASLDYAAEPSYLPEGFRLSSAFVSTSADGEQLDAYYRRSESGAAMGEIRITQITDVEIMPPSSEDLVSIRFGDIAARWSPLRSELEWLAEDTYRAVDVPGFDLDTAVRIARGMSS
jgi:hypothetical protein